MHVSPPAGKPVSTCGPACTPYGWSAAGIANEVVAARRCSAQRWEVVVQCVSIEAMISLTTPELMLAQRSCIGKSAYTAATDWVSFRDPSEANNRNT